jgi:hypothetical protein
VTATVTVQLPPAGITPPVNETTEYPTGALTVPPQLVLAVPDTDKPAGNVSVKADVMLADVVFGLLKVRVSVELPPAVIEGSLKDLPSTGGALTGGAAHEETVAVVESSVTAPLSASALPVNVAPVSKVTLARAITVPIKFVPVPRVAELPTCQKTSHRCAPPMSATEALLAVMRVLPIRKMKGASELPLALRVTVPVSVAEDAKQ